MHIYSMHFFFFTSWNANVCQNLIYPIRFFGENCPVQYLLSIIVCYFWYLRNLKISQVSIFILFSSAFFWNRHKISFWMVCQMTMFEEVKFFDVSLVSGEKGRVHRRGKIGFLGDSDLEHFWQFLGPSSTFTSKNWIVTIYIQASLNKWQCLGGFTISGIC